MRVLVTSLLFPLPTNVARGTFVSDHVELLKNNGHEVRVVNPLPRMFQYQEFSRSTHTGVARAPKNFKHGEIKLTRISIYIRAKTLYLLHSLLKFFRTLD